MGLNVNPEGKETKTESKVDKSSENLNQVQTKELADEVAKSDVVLPKTGEEKSDEDLKILIGMISMDIKDISNPKDIDKTMLANKRDFLRNNAEVQQSLKNVMINIMRNVGSREQMKVVFSTMGIDKKYSDQEISDFYNLLSKGDFDGNTEVRNKVEAEKFQILLGQASDILAGIMASNSSKPRGVDGMVGEKTLETINIFSQRLYKNIPSMTQIDPKDIKLLVDNMNIDELKSGIINSSKKASVYNITLNSSKPKLFNFEASLSSGNSNSKGDRVGINQTNQQFAEKIVSDLLEKERAVVEGGVGINYDKGFSAWFKTNLDKIIPELKNMSEKMITKAQWESILSEAQTGNTKLLQDFVDNYVRDAGMDNGDLAEITVDTKDKPVNLRIERRGNMLVTFLDGQEKCSRPLRTIVDGSIAGGVSSDIQDKSNIKEGSDYVAGQLEIEKHISDGLYALAGLEGAYADNGEKYGDVGSWKGRAGLSYFTPDGKFNTKVVAEVIKVNKLYDAKNRKLISGVAAEANYKINDRATIGGGVEYNQVNKLSGSIGGKYVINQDKEISLEGLLSYNKAIGGISEGYVGSNKGFGGEVSIGDGKGNRIAAEAAKDYVGVKATTNIENVTNTVKKILKKN